MNNWPVLLCSRSATPHSEQKLAKHDQNREKQTTFIYAKLMFLGVNLDLFSYLISYVSK